MLKSYASYFVSYLLDNIKTVDNIERIILFGSVSKNEATKESDVDLFIEVKKLTDKFRKDIKGIEESFYKSREATLFKVKNIDNVFSIKIGKLKDWETLHRSIASTGIIFYSKYETKDLPKGLKHNIVIYWDKININRGAFLNKVYGFKVGEKHYRGLLEKFNGKKIGKSCILIPIIYKQEIFDLLKKHKVEAKSIEIFS